MSTLPPNKVAARMAHSYDKSAPPPGFLPKQQRAALAIATNLPTQMYPCNLPSAPPRVSHAPGPDTAMHTKIHEPTALMSTFCQPPMPQSNCPDWQPPSTPTAVNTNHWLNTAEKHFSKHCIHPAFQAKYILGEELGSGGFGFVCRATRRCDYRDVAVKFVYRNKVPNVGWARDPEFGIVPMEIYFIHQLQHDNIIRFIDYYEDHQFFYLITELHGTPWNSEKPAAPLPNATSLVSESPLSSSPNSIIGQSDDASLPPLSTSPASPPPSPQIPVPSLQRRNSFDLFECIEQHEHFSEQQALHVFRQVASAVLYLHKLGIVHRDIKDENILIDDKFHVKLIDFGSAAFSEGKLFDRFLGTIQYASPEILRGEKYRGPEADIWALGCCLYIMLNGEVPFDNPAHALHSPFTPPKYKLTPECVDLLAWMLDKRPASRATIFDIWRHPWMQNQFAMSSPPSFMPMMPPSVPIAQPGVATAAGPGSFGGRAVNIPPVTPLIGAPFISSMSL
ncbi:hypothetical protein HK102_000389 [Quaeritorhiza haematococci]|nr:hypothetical protein HK102_000389 [Quaeritorhiza haematococci]